MNNFISNNTLKAVYSDDLDQWLVSKGIYDEFVSGKIKCKYCNEQINKHNLYAIIPGDEGITFCCDKPECMTQMIEYASKPE